MLSTTCQRSASFTVNWKNKAHNNRPEFETKLSKSPPKKIRRPAWPWKWSHYDDPKRREPLIQWQGITSQNGGYLITRCLRSVFVALEAIHNGIHHNRFYQTQRLASSLISFKQRALRVHILWIPSSGMLHPCNRFKGRLLKFETSRFAAKPLSYSHTHSILYLCSELSQHNSLGREDYSSVFILWQWA